jgi:formate C-acetyltransferase
MKSDCFQLQFNVVDSAVLKDAQENPEKYDALMVRVAGYSDYFRNLPREIQDEIISRTEHGVI